MYNDDVIRVPADEDELWAVLREQFDFVHSVLWESTVESREEALANTHHNVTEEGHVHRDGMTVVRYRNIGAGLDNRDHFLELGRSLLPFIDEEIDLRRMSPEFVQKWGMIMFCHGYIASHIMDDSDDLAHQRAGKRGGRARSRDLQKKWAAHVMVPLMNGGRTRADAEDELVRRVKYMQERRAFPPGFTKEWFDPIINRGNLVTTLQAKHFTNTAMRELYAETADDIPPTEFP